MSSSMLVLPLQGRGYINSTLTQVVDMYGTEVPMKISKTSVDFDALTINGVTVTATGTLEVADITDLTSTAAEINTLHSSGVTNADLVKLHTVTASAVELSKLAGAGTKVATGTTAALIADPVGAALDTDTEARAAIASIIDALQAFGIVALV